jgi:2-succinyl-5-enolpyruvyl-6-hydroxy-3-cyclohexene-1-carboxylate synthase
LFDPIDSVTFWSNRGTSGIDGSSSTAVGAAVANPNQLHVLVTGDVSFFYDSNALWNAYLPSNLRIILVNNGGGGIFRIIDGANSSPQTSTYFEAQHQQCAEYIAKTFDIDYSSIHSEDEFENSMKVFYQIDATNRPKLIEVFTPRDQNHLVLKEFFNVVSERFQ